MAFFWMDLKSTTKSEVGVKTFTEVRHMFILLVEVKVVIQIISLLQ